MQEMASTAKTVLTSTLEENLHEPRSTGTDAEFDALKSILELVISEKEQHEQMVKQLNEQEAAKLRVRQEQADSVANLTLEILERNSDAFISSPPRSPTPVSLSEDTYCEWHVHSCVNDLNCVTEHRIIVPASWG